MKKIIIALSTWLMINCAVAVIPANVDHSDLTLGQSLTLTIDVSKADAKPDLSVLDSNFEVYGTSSSSQTSIINGHVNSQKNLIITLSPKNLGRQTIPAIKIGNEYTNPIQINVDKPSDSEIAAQNRQIFITAKISDNQTEYVGVPLIYSIKLYYAVNIANVGMSNIDIKGANIQPLGKSIQYTEQIKGNEYQVLEQKFQITPTQSGTINIPAIRINGNIINDNMNNFLTLTQPKPFSVSTKAMSLSVKPIPASFTDKEWFPAKQVMLSESQSTTTDNIKVGQPITRTIVVQATGVPYTSIPELSLPTPNNVNAYPDKTSGSNSLNGDEIISTKVFKTAYIPTQPGTLEFPAITVKWWDISSNSLKTSTIAAKTYTVLNDAGQAVTEKAPITQEQPATTTVAGQAPQKNLWLYIALSIAVLWAMTILIAVWLYRKKSLTKTTPYNQVDKPLPEKKVFNLVIKACREQNVINLNNYLIKWAKLYWNKKIYTVLDIKDLTANEKLKVLLEELNQAVYRGNIFNKFNELEHEISQITTAAHTESKNGLKELYPQ